MKGELNFIINKVINHIKYINRGSTPVGTNFKRATDRFESSKIHGNFSCSGTR